MKDRQVSIAIEKLVAMFIIAMGVAIGEGFTYFPKLPTCFIQHLDFNRSCGCYANFLCLRVNTELKVECWFEDESGDTFSYGLDEVKCVKPILWTSIITHVFDMIENVKEC